MNIIFLVAEVLGSPAKVDPLYLDPGSGSFLIQLVIASALGAALVFKTSWSRIKNFFTRTSNESEDEPIETEDE